MGSFESSVGFDASRAAAGIQWGNLKEALGLVPGFARCSGIARQCLRPKAQNSFVTSSRVKFGSSDQKGVCEHGFSFVDCKSCTICKHGRLPKFSFACQECP